MITLQQTAGNNNQTIWCLRLRGEGSNIVSNSTFDSSTGWTLSGDFAISSGTLNYIYSANSAGAARYTVSATSNQQYVLEYEVTNTVGSGYTLLTESGGTNIFQTSIELDLSLGKHILYFEASSGGTLLGIAISGTGAGDEIYLDNIKVRKVDNIVYLSTKDITLDNTYDGQVLNYDNYLSDVTYPSSIIGGGGTGSVTSFSFSISRHVTNTNFNSFFNELYPATDAGYYVSRIVDFGVCWEGATTDTEITWLLRGRIIDYNYEQRRLTFSSFQESELTNKEVPYYTVQKDSDNGVSYYQYAPDENYGLVLPIIYGSFNIDTFDYDLKRVVPSICVDKRYFTFVQSAHKLYTQNSPTYTNALYKYIAGLDTYLVLIPDNGTSYNFNFRATISLLSSSRVANELIKGKLFIVPKSIGYTSDYNEIESILDRDNSTNITISDTEELSVRTEGEASTNDVGVLGQSSSDCQIFVSWQSNDGGNRQITLKYWNQAIATPAYGGSTSSTTTSTGGTWVTATHNFGTSTTSKNDADLPWTIEEICNLDFVAANTSGTGATSGDLNIRQFVIILSNIIVSSLLKKKTNVSALSAGGEI